MATTKIVSEITGSVWKMLAKPGDVLQADGTLMVLESMKMEIPVMVSDGGRVLQVLVAERDSVIEGQVLAVIET